MGALKKIKLTGEATALRKSVWRDFAKLTAAATRKIPMLPGKSLTLTTGKPAKSGSSTRTN